MVTIDSEGLFEAAAAVVGTIAVLMFVFSVDFPYSPVSRVALVALFLAGVFAITQRSAEFRTVVLGYGVVVVSTVALLFYLTGTFDVGTTGTVFGLLILAGLLFALRNRLDADGHFVSGRRATDALAVVAVLVAVVLVVDVATGGLAYELRTESEVTVAGAEPRELHVGSVVVTNPTPFPERVDAPRYRACAAGNWSAHRPPSEPDGPRRDVRVHASVQSGYGEHVFGFSTRTYPVVLHVDGSDLRDETFPVRVTDACPDEDTGEPYVALFEDRENGRVVVAA